MQQTLKTYYDLIHDLKTQDEFLEEISRYKQEYDDLFTQDVIALLIIDELHRNPQKTIPIKDIQAGMECSITGIITDLADTKTFTRKNNTKGKLKKCIITDQTGSIPVLLWNEDTDLLDQSHATNHSQVTIINGYTKKGYRGMELNVGRWSQIEISSTNNASMQKHHSKEQSEITGILEKIEPTTIFFRDDGTEGFMTRIHLSTKKGMKTMVCWDETVRTIQQFTLKDTITIKPITYRYVNGLQELHINGNAVIEKEQT